jgi:hypothetical protein
VTLTCSRTPGADSEAWNIALTPQSPSAAKSSDALDAASNSARTDPSGSLTHGGTGCDMSTGVWRWRRERRAPVAQ